MSNFDDMSRNYTARKEAGESLMEWSVALNSQAADWDLETVKHLVILNAAGVAGSTTLLASTTLAGVKSGLTVALAPFAIGVILAVLNFHLASRSFHEMSLELRDRAATEAQDPNVSVDHNLFRDPKAGSKTNAWAVRMGIASAVCAILGTLALILTLLIT